MLSSYRCTCSNHRYSSNRNLAAGISAHRFLLDIHTVIQLSVKPYSTVDWIEMHRFDGRNISLIFISEWIIRHYAVYSQKWFPLERFFSSIVISCFILLEHVAGWNVLMAIDHGNDNHRQPHGWIRFLYFIRYYFFVHFSRISLDMWWELKHMKHGGYQPRFWSIVRWISISIVFRVKHFDEKFVD